MRIRLDLTLFPATVEMIDPADFTTLRLVVAGTDEVGVANAALSRYGHISGRDTALLHEAGVRELAEGFVTAGWQRRFDELVDRVAAPGALDDGLRLRVGVDWQ